MVRFTFRQLEYFVAVAQHGTFRAAARECRISETALAQSVTELEHSLEQSLFLRQRSRGVTLTAEGRTLLPLARSLVDQAEELSGAAQELRSEIVGPLTIGCLTSFSPFVAPTVLADFAAAHPKLDLKFVEGDPIDLQRQLIDGQLDCVVLQERQALPEIEVRPLRASRPWVVLSANHRLASNPVVSLHDLASESMVLLDSPAVSLNLLPTLEALGFRPRIGLRTKVFETVRSMVARNLGWTVLITRPPGDLSYENLPLVYRPPKEAVPHDRLSIGYIRARPLTVRVRAIEEHLRDHFRGVDGPSRDDPACAAIDALRPTERDSDARPPEQE